MKNSISKNTGIFGSFFLGDSEFALAVENVQEVVNTPEKYTALPLSPDYLLGMFSLRGEIIPVIDLRTILKITSEKTGENNKIAIIEYGAFSVGLLFDQTGEIFRDHHEERCDFENSGDAVVNGVFKRDGGKRIIQILSVEGLFRLQNVPHQESAQNRSRRGNQAAKTRGPRKQCISFLVGPAVCSLDMQSIQEIIKVEGLNDSALAVGQCIGNIELRGNIVAVIDFAAHLGYREPDRTAQACSGDRRVIVMKIEQELFGLLVDSIDSIVSYFADELVAFPVLAKDRQEMFLGCISKPEKSDILLLDHNKIISDSEIHSITKGHSKLYKTLTGRAEEKKTKGLRKAYITFHLLNAYAVNIDEVREIIEYPQDMLRPPGLPSHFRGVLNLRGELVTVVDGRSMYQMSESGEGLLKAKVIIFKNDQIKYGLVVDSVDAILNIAENDKIKLPELLYRENVGNMAEDVLEAVQVTGDDNQKLSVLILNPASIAKRVESKKAA